MTVSLANNGKKKDAELVTRTFYSIERPIDEINILHTDRGNEFKNKAIDQILDTFDIERSLSKKGCPYDNAVAGLEKDLAKIYHQWPNTIFGDYIDTL